MLSHIEVNALLVVFLGMEIGRRVGELDVAMQSRRGLRDGCYMGAAQAPQSGVRSTLADFAQLEFLVNRAIFTTFEITKSADSVRMCFVFHRRT